MLLLALVLLRSGWCCWDWDGGKGPETRQICNTKQTSTACCTTNYIQGTVNEDFAAGSCPCGPNLTELPPGSLVTGLNENNCVETLLAFLPTKLSMITKCTLTGPG